MTQTPMEVMSTFTKVVPAYDNYGLRAILHEDVVVHEAPTLPYGGDHRGKDAFIRLFEWVNELWGFTETFNYTVYDSGPETVIVLVEVDSYAKKTGSPLLIRVLENLHDPRGIDSGPRRLLLRHRRHVRRLGREARDRFSYIALPSTVPPVGGGTVDPAKCAVGGYIHPSGASMPYLVCTSAYIWASS